jgi:hypothetical protein
VGTDLALSPDDDSEAEVTAMARGHRTSTLRLIAGLVGLALAAGLSPAWAVSGGDEELFLFRKGTRWSYVGTSNGSRTTVNQEVFKVSQGEFFAKGEPATLHHLIMRSVVADGPTGGIESVSTTGYVGVEGGYFVTGSLGGAPVRLYRLGSKPGDTWPCTDPRLKSPSDHLFTHMGLETVSVPAGVFRNARHVQVQVRSQGVTSTGDFYIVPGVGIVKTGAVSEGNGVTRHVELELEKFSPPGEF